MDLDRVRGYFNEAATVAHYARAVSRVGLWESERSVVCAHLRKSDRILDLGCGAGRVASGLWQEGFTSVTGADLAESMVAEARDIAAFLGFPISFQQEDATALSYPDETFDGVIFAFNGLMQIPGRDSRRQALQEISRVLRPGGAFIFSALDRDDALYRRVFSDASDFNQDPLRNPNLLEFGDRHFQTEHGTTFMHVPKVSEVAAELQRAGFNLLENRKRSAIARESAATLEFSEDCRIWVARRQ